jgi:hypothetical protein
MHEDDTDARRNTPDQLSQPERRRNIGAAYEETMSVRLIHKYANMIDGVNLAHNSVGDHLRLSRRDASILIAEGWAVRAVERRGRTLPQRSLAADSPPASRRKPKP